MNAAFFTETTAGKHAFFDLPRYIGSRVDEAGVGAFPIGIRGAYQAWPKGTNWPKPGRPPVAMAVDRAGVPGDEELGRLHAPGLRRIGIRQRLAIPIRERGSRTIAP